MTHEHGQPPPAAGTHLVLYDGVCGLCNRLLVFVIERDPRAVFSFASLQSAVGRATVERLGGNPAEPSSFLVLMNYREENARMLDKSNAALFVAGELGWPWKCALLLRALPTALLDLVYDFIARHRYRVFGRYEHCLVPRAEFKSRFIE